MAINSRKISAFSQLSSISGEEYLLVAYKGKSYKIPTKLLTGNALQTINQKINSGDGADNPVTLTVGTGSDAETFTLHVYNGTRGSEGPKGEQGDKGEKGDTGIALYDYEELEDFICDDLEDDSDNLEQKALSAAQGKILNDKLDELKEVFLSQTEYDDLVNKDAVDANTKYFIWES
jgi:hypothetical protein